MHPDHRIAIVETIYDVEQSEQPFGKRWRQEEITLRAEHLAALQQGKLLALDVQEEYVVFLNLDAAIEANRGWGMVDRPDVVYRLHATLRMAERGISRAEVDEVIAEGETIERYDDEKPYPSRLLFSAVAGRPLHVVAAWNAGEREWIVITTYEPTQAEWYPDYTRRRP